MLKSTTTGMVAAGLVAAFVSVAGAQGRGETVKIMDVPGTGNMLYRIAAGKGYCEKYGIKCQLQLIPSGPLGVQALLAKSIDLALASPEVPINAVLKGSKIKIIHLGSTLNPFLIVVRNDLDLPNADKGYTGFLGDLKGKKIGVPARGSGGELQFGLLASKAGLKPDDFTFVAVGSPNTSYGALTSKQIDASMSFEPHSSMCDVLKTCKTVYRGNSAKEPAEIVGTNGAASVQIVTQEMINNSPHVVDALIAAAKDAETFIQDPKNLDEILRISRTYFKFEMPRGDEVMDVSIKSQIPAYKIAVSRDALKQVVANMLATKQLEAPFDTGTLIYEKAP